MPVTLEDLVSRVREDAREVQHALASLARSQLVLRHGDTARLSLAGLAVAVAATAQATASRATTSRATPRIGVPAARVVPMVRRRRAA